MIRIRSILYLRTCIETLREKKKNKKTKQNKKPKKKTKNKKDKTTREKEHKEKRKSKYPIIWSVCVYIYIYVRPSHAEIHDQMVLESQQNSLSLSSKI